MRSLLCLAIICLVPAILADNDFGKEVTEGVFKFHDAGEGANILDYIPKDAHIVIDYVREYFNNKKLMTTTAPKVFILKETTCQRLSFVN